MNSNWIYSKCQRVKRAWFWYAASHMTINKNISTVITLFSELYLNWTSLPLHLALVTVSLTFLIMALPKVTPPEGRYPECTGYVCTVLCKFKNNIIMNEHF